MPAGSMTRTVVSFHAHPDDEALLTGGSLAMLAAAGHRVVLVVATSGGLGLSGESLTANELAAVRLEEVERSAAALGCARVVTLGFADSGWSPDGSTGPAANSFTLVAVADAARRLADVLEAEQADILTIYDRHGGYGHLDHVRVHDVGLAAAALAGTPRVLEATIDRTLLRRVMRVLGALRLVPHGTAVDARESWFSGRDEITHRIPVGAFANAKRAALACHASQATGGEGLRTAALLLRLPRPLFRRVCGTEWFIETGAPVPRPRVVRPVDLCRRRSSRSGHERFGAVMSGRPSVRNALRAAVSTLLLCASAAIVYTLPKLISSSWTDIISRIGAISFGTILAILGLWVLGLIVYTIAMTSSMPGLSHRRAMALNLAGSSASNLLPFGGVIGAGLNVAMVRSWRLSVRNFVSSTAVLNLVNLVTQAAVTDHRRHRAGLAARRRSVAGSHGVRQLGRSRGRGHRPDRRTDLTQLGGADGCVGPGHRSTNAAGAELASPRHRPRVSARSRRCRSRCGRRSGAAGWA